jgi:hypothetical protein
MIPDAALPPLESSRRDQEGAQVNAWRLHILVEVGYPIDLAEQIAARAGGPDEVDLHEAVNLIARGCSHRLAGEILL